MSIRFKYTRFIAAAFWLRMLVFFIGYLVDFTDHPDEYLRYSGQPLAHLMQGYVHGILAILWCTAGIVFPCLPQRIGRPLVRTHAAAAFLFYLGEIVIASVWYLTAYDSDQIFQFNF